MRSLSKWLLLALLLAVIPMACGDDDDVNGGTPDAAVKVDSMTPG